ncbi:MAG: DUF3857 domain-containing protein [Candidatus Acidiferrales bacterium]
MTLNRIVLCSALAATLAIAGSAPGRAATGDQWQPIDPADLAMKSEPLAPGASAIYLYREVVGDDLGGTADYYYRVKILTDAGKKFGAVEIAYNGAYDHVAMIRGRTIHPDGTIVPWEGKALDQIVVRAHGVKVLESTFNMPDVETGSIIEYKYRVEWDPQLLFRTTWYVNEDLFTRQLHCTLKRYEEAYVLMMQAQRVPPNVTATRGADDLVHLDAQNLPGIESEDFAPPDDAIQGKFDFYYTDDQTTDPNKYWKKQGKEWYDETEKFVGHNSAVRDEADKVAPSSDPQETRLRKLYARAQQIRNLSNQPEKTAEEIKSEKLKDDKTAEDVLKNGYGYDTDVNWFFIALARAAGFDASSVRISGRSQYFFSPRILDERQMDGDVVLVKLNGQDLFLDPAAPHCGFGQLPWPETGVQGLALDDKGGTFVTTTSLKSSDAVVQRTATLQMGDDGWLKGKLVVVFSGQEAMARRQNADDQDDADRAKTLTDEVTSWLAAGATLTLTNQPDWAGSDNPLRAEFDVRTRPVGANAGHRVLLSENFFSDAGLPRFDHPLRVYPIYFDYPWEYRDDVTLTLPLLLEADDLPAPVNHPTPFGTYQLSCTKEPGALHFERSVTLDGFYYDMQYYAPLRTYFDEARNADQMQVMLEAAGAQGTQAKQ